MYHHINPAGNFVNVKPHIFENQMRFLNKQGFTTLNTNDFLSIIEGSVLLPEKPIMITFDDGWLDNWIYAFPILKKYGIKAVVFAVTSFIQERGIRQRSDEGVAHGLPPHNECLKMIESGLASDVMCSWAELGEMEKSGLVEVQSHTHTHKRWDRLYADPLERIKALRDELLISRNIIEERLGKRCDSLCWPWGKYDVEYIAAAKEAGYKILFTTDKGTNTIKTDPMKIKRLVIGNIGLFSFRKKLFIHSRDWLSKAYLRYFK